MALNAETRLESYELGVGGVIRAGGWCRFELTAASYGEPFEGTARVSLGGMSAAREMFIPAGGSVRWESTARVSSFGSGGTLTLNSANGGARTFPLEFQPNANEKDVVVLSVASRRGAFHAAFQTDAQSVQLFETGAPDNFPDTWIGWKSVDALVWFAGDVALNRLSARQENALEQWVLQGGTIKVVLDDSTRGALPPFWERLLSDDGWRSVGLGRARRYDGQGPHPWDPTKTTPRVDEGEEYLQRLSGRLSGGLSGRLHVSGGSGSPLKRRRYALGAGVWVVLAALFWSVSIRFRSRLWWIALLAAGVGISLAPLAAQMGSPLLTPRSSGVVRVFPESQTAVWTGVIEAEPTDKRNARIALPGEVRLIPVNKKHAGERRIGEIRGYSPSEAHSTFWIGEAFTPFVGEIAGVRLSGGRCRAVNKTPLHFERAAILADGRIQQLGELPSGGLWEGELRSPLRSMRALWSGLETPSRALAFWAREGRLDRLMQNGGQNGGAYVVGWTRGASPFAQRGADKEILLVVYPLNWE